MGSAIFFWNDRNYSKLEYGNLNMTRELSRETTWGSDHTDHEKKHGTFLSSLVFFTKRTGFPTLIELAAEQGCLKVG